VALDQAVGSFRKDVGQDMIVEPDIDLVLNDDGSIKTITQLQVDQIFAVLMRVGGRRTKAAKLLGMNYRTLTNWVYRYEVFERFKRQTMPVAEEKQEMDDRYPG